MTRRTSVLAAVALLPLGACAGPPRRAAPEPARLAELGMERDALLARLMAELAERDIGLAEAPNAALAIGVPGTFTRSLVEQLATGYLGEVTLTLRDLRVQTQGNVSGRVLFGRRRLGEYTLDAHIRRVRGVLKPRTPTLGFADERIALRMPVRLAGGYGRATLRFTWDGKGLAGVACGDIDVTRDVTATVAPAIYSVDGAFDVSSGGGDILVTPRFDDLVVRLYVRPTEDAWKTLDAVAGEQGFVCRTALRKVDLRSKLEGVLGDGFSVKVPKTLLTSMRFPAGVEQSVELEGRALSVEATPVGLRLTDRRLWYGADVAIAREAPRPDAGSGPSG